MNEYLTKWAKETAPYGASDENVIFETEADSSFVMRDEEFEWLAERLHSLWSQMKSIDYIQILREWNENTGFQDIEGNTSAIEDLSATVDALEKVEAGSGDRYGELRHEDLSYLIRFINENISSRIFVRKE